MISPQTNIRNHSQEFDIEVLVKNDRVVVCKLSAIHSGPFYMQYHTAAGWRDLDNGDTALSRRMPTIIHNPFELA